MSSPFEEAQKITNVWAEFAAKMATAGMTVDPSGGQSPPDAAKSVRAAALSAMSQYAQQFMRSQQFMEMMKQSMDASIAWQRQMNDFLTKAHHAGESVARSDLSDLHQSVRHLEQRTLDQMEQLAAKLDQISQRLDAIEERNDRNSDEQMQTSGRQS